jgi:hypothetical protein
MILDFNQSKIMKLIDSKSLERDAGGKPVPTFPHPALATMPFVKTNEMTLRNGRLPVRHLNFVQSNGLPGNAPEHQSCPARMRFRR